MDLQNKKNNYINQELLTEDHRQHGSCTNEDQVSKDENAKLTNNNRTHECGFLTQVTRGNKRVQYRHKSRANEHEIPVTSGVHWTKGQSPHLEDAQERLQNSILPPPKTRIIVPIAVQRTTYAPRPEQISHLRQGEAMRLKKFDERKKKKDSNLSDLPLVMKIAHFGYTQSHKDRLASLRISGGNPVASNVINGAGIFSPCT